MAPSDDEPRCRHYVFAHQALPSVAFSRPLAFLGVLGGEDARSFLANILSNVSEHCRENEPEPDFTIDDIAVQTTRVGAYPCAVIVMPTPRAVPEAFFVAAVLLNRFDQPLTEDVRLRYFTLEKGGPLVPEGMAVLCEWTADWTHSNFGAAFSPELPVFLDAVAQLVGEAN